MEHRQSLKEELRDALGKLVLIGDLPAPDVDGMLSTFVLTSPAIGSAKLFSHSLTALIQGSHLFLFQNKVFGVKW